MHDRSIFLPTAEAYDRWSKSYDVYDNPMVFGACRVVEHLAAVVRGKDVFEFGCGTGRNLLALQRMGAAGVAGCDLSSGMLEEARRLGPSLRLFRHDMLEPLPLEARTVDVALFCLTLEHLADFAIPLSEARRVLRPSGRIEIIEIHPYVSMGGVSAHFRDNGETVRMPTFAHCFATYLNAFAGLGLRVSACREWRPQDFCGELPDKVLKRGADCPLLVQFSVVAE